MSKKPLKDGTDFVRTPNNAKRLFTRDGAERYISRRVKRLAGGTKLNPVLLDEPTHFTVRVE